MLIHRSVEISKARFGPVPSADITARDGAHFREQMIRPGRRGASCSVVSRFDFIIRTSFFGETQTVDFAHFSRRNGVRYWVRSGLIPSRAKALVWSGVGRA